MLIYTKFQYYIETIYFTFCGPANLELSTQSPGEWPFWPGQNLEITWNFMTRTYWGPWLYYHEFNCLNQLTFDYNPSPVHNWNTSYTVNKLTDLTKECTHMVNIHWHYMRDLFDKMTWFLINLWKNVETRSHVHNAGHMTWSWAVIRADELWGQMKMINERKTAIVWWIILWSSD